MGSRAWILTLLRDLRASYWFLPLVLVALSQVLAFSVLWLERTPRKQQIKASLPLLLCSDTPPAVTHLGNYPPKSRQARRDRKIGGEPIIERLHLYLYQG